MRAILMRSQFSTAIRHAIGWRGLQQVVSGAEGWTAKIRGWSGVFGIYFESWTLHADWHAGNFGLCYFPDPEEELVERCSLHAAAFCQQPDYLKRVRNFLMIPEMLDIFGIGRLSLGVQQCSDAIGLSMACLSRQRTICPDGVYLEKNGHQFKIIAPGGYERDFPAFEAARSFFDVLAASLTVFLEESPSSFRERRFPGWAFILGQAGNPRKSEASDIEDIRIELGYGNHLGNAFCLLQAEPAIPTVDIHWRFPDPIPEAYAERPWWRNHMEQPEKTSLQSARMAGRPPVILVSGFLGAGKTSFLKHFIEYQTQRSRFVAVIQNEIGEIGLDGKILDYTVTEIDDGCVCCSLSGSLSQAIRKIVSEFQPDTIVIETTGLANPLNLLDDMIAVKDLVRFECTLTVVDALNIEQTLADYPLAADQIRAADILMLNKVDQVGPQPLQAITDQIRRFNPNAPLFQTVDGNLNPALVLEAEGRLSGKETSRHLSQSHTTHRPDDVWSATIRIPHPMDRKAFLDAVSTFPMRIFRAKGLLKFHDCQQPVLFQYVAGQVELSPSGADPSSEQFITFIGRRKDAGTTIGWLQSIISQAE